MFGFKRKTVTILCLESLQNHLPEKLRAEQAELAKTQQMDHVESLSLIFGGCTVKTQSSPSWLGLHPAEGEGVCLNVHTHGQGSGRHSRCLPWPGLAIPVYMQRTHSPIWWHEVEIASFPTSNPSISLCNQNTNFYFVSDFCISCSLKEIELEVWEG